MKQDQDHIGRLAIRTWGSHAQIDQVIEEMAELTAALLHHRRGRPDSILEVTEEIADVELMLSRLRMIFCADARIDQMKEQKLRRTADRILSSERLT